MLCESCGLALRIVRSGSKAEQQGNSILLYHCHVLACRNQNCARKGQEIERKSLLWQGAGKLEQP